MVIVSTIISIIHNCKILERNQSNQDISQLKQYLSCNMHQSKSWVSKIIVNKLGRLLRVSFVLMELLSSVAIKLNSEINVTV